MIAAAIWAKGESRRLPGKNIKMMNGKPLLMWTIIQAQCAHLVDEVFLSTDNDYIADMAAEAGVTVVRRPVRPQSICANEPRQHFLCWCKEYRPEIEATLSILPTSPHRLPGDIDAVIRLYKRFNTTAGFTCVSPETVVHERIDDKTSKIIIWDKKNSYCFGGGGMGCANNQVTYDEICNQDFRDDVFDNNFHDMNKIHINYQGRFWQAWDINDQEEFDFIEAVMEAMILKGRGAEVYYEYARGEK